MSLQDHEKNKRLHETIAWLDAPHAQGGQLEKFADKLAEAIKARDFRDDWGPFDVQQSCSEMVHEVLDDFVKAVPQQETVEVGQDEEKPKL